jgi:hypothetical protein
LLQLLAREMCLQRLQARRSLCGKKSSAGGPTGTSCISQRVKRVHQPRAALSEAPGLMSATMQVLTAAQDNATATPRVPLTKTRSSDDHAMLSRLAGVKFGPQTTVAASLRGVSPPPPWRPSLRKDAPVAQQTGNRLPGRPVTAAY